MTTNIGSLAVSLSLDAASFNGSIDRVNRNLGAMGSEMRAVRGLGTQYGNSLDGLRSKKDILTRSVGASTIKLEAERRKYDELVASGTASEAQLERQARRVNEAQAQYNHLETELNQVNTAIQTQSSSWHQLSQSLAPIGSRLTAIGKGMTSVGKQLSMKVTAPLVAMGTGAFKAAVDFESAFAGVRKTVDATEEEFSNLEKGIRDMAKAGPTAATELAAIGESAGQLGIATENILTFTSTVSDIAVATNMTAEQAATDFARFANITSMPQTNFDKLGSSIVALGNNFATTESEIMGMAMRLAGAGAQVGMSESDILGLSAALTSVGIEAEMGGSAISKVMVNMQVATSSGFTKVQEVMKKTGMSVRELQMMASHSGKAFGNLAEDMSMTKKELTNLLKAGVDLESFSKIAGMTGEEFKNAFEKDAVGALGAFINGLGGAEEAGESAINMLQEMGITEVRLRDALLRAGNASELFAGAVDLSNNAWDENNALTKEASQRYKTTASQMKTLWNQIKDVGISLGNILIPKVQALMNKLKPLIERFANMSKESQNTALAIGGIAAAIGPLLVVGGTLMSGLGGTITLVSTLAGGIAGAGGLTAAITAMSGPIGWTVGGLALLAGAVIGVVGATKKKNEVTAESVEISFETIEAQQKEIKSTDDLIKKYDDLRLKNMLSNEQMLRFLDINTELAQTASPDKIKALNDEQGKLLEKSGLTNAEMQDFLKYNDEIIEKSPATYKAISDQGNAYALNANELKSVNAEKLESLKIDAEIAINNSIGKENKLLAEQKKLVEEIKQKEEGRQETRKKINILSSDIIVKEEEMAELAKDKSRHGQEILAQAQLELAELEKKKKAAEINLSLSLAEIDARQDSLDIVREDLKKLDETKYKYEAIILATVGLNSEKGKGLQTIQTELQKLDAQKEKLKQLHSAGKLNTSEYQEQIGKINTQIGKLQSANAELENINTTAGKTIYKGVIIKSDPSIEQFERRLSNPLSKNINITTTGGGRHLQPGFAKGTRNAPGGLAWVGELGRELLHIDGGMYLASGPSLVNLPKGAKVIPNQDTEAILSKWHIPMLAKGGSAVTDGLAYIAERGRELVDLSGAGARTKPLSNMNQKTQQPVIIEIPIFLDSDSIGKGTSGVIDNILNSNFQTKLIMNGVR